MISADNPLRLTQDLIDAEVRECPALGKFYAAGQKLGKIVIVDQQVNNHEISSNKKP